VPRRFAAVPDSLLHCAPGVGQCGGSRGSEEKTVPDEGLRKPIPAKKKTYRAKHKVRFVTATSLFDGHDASINIFRRILQGSGAEVIHLGHNRSV
jgi:hypothetical protein